MSRNSELIPNFLINFSESSYNYFHTDKSESINSLILILFTYEFTNIVRI